MDFASNNNKKRSLDSGSSIVSRKTRRHEDFNKAYRQVKKPAHQLGDLGQSRGSSARPGGQSLNTFQQNRVNRLSDMGSNVRRHQPPRKMTKKQNSEKAVSQDNQDFMKQEGAQERKKTVVILDKLVMVSIFMLFAGLPLFFLNLTYQGINFEKQYYFYLWTFIGLVAWGAKSIVVGSLTIRRTPLDLVLLSFLIVCGVSTIFSIDRYHSFFGFFSNPTQGFVSVLIMTLAYYLIIMNVNYSRSKILFVTTVVVGSLVSIWVSLGVLGVIPIDIFNKIPLNFVGVSFSSLATYLGMLLSFLLV